MPPNLWQATLAGRQPVQGLGAAREGDAALDGDALRDRCRRGDVLLRGRGWRTEVFLDPLAHPLDGDWPQRLRASLGATETDLLLHLLSGNEWQTSRHATPDDLREEAGRWIGLTGSAVRRSFRLPPDRWTAAALEAAVPWWDGSPSRLAALLAALAAAPAASADALLAAALHHEEVCEGLVAGLVPADDGGHLLAYLGQRTEQQGRLGLALPQLADWLIEAIITGRAILAERSAADPDGCGGTVVAPVRLLVPGPATGGTALALRLAHSGATY